MAHDGRALTLLQRPHVPSGWSVQYSVTPSPRQSALRGDPTKLMAPWPHPRPQRPLPYPSSPIRARHCARPLFSKAYEKAGRSRSAPRTKARIHATSRCRD